MGDGRRIYDERRSKRPFKIGPKAIAAWKRVGLTCLVIALVSGYFVYIHARKNPRPEPSLPADSLLYATVPADIPSQDLDYEGFHVSFNEAHHVPNYVSWELTREKAKGTLKRVSNFQPDLRVKGCALLEDYRRSGYDRGHMAPAGDMKWSAKAMNDCHYLTNIIPQDHGVNQGLWNTLENLTRSWVEYDGKYIIFSGPVLTDECPVKIGQSGVTVPERLFKIIMAPNANPPMALAFIVPNSMPTEQYAWYNVSVDEVEELTGLDFFASLPDSIEDRMERMRSLPAWKNRIKILKSEQRNL